MTTSPSPLDEAESALTDAVNALGRARDAVRGAGARWRKIRRIELVVDTALAHVQAVKRGAERIAAEGNRS